MRLATCILLVLAAMLCVTAPATAVQVKETDIMGYNGGNWQRLTKGELLGATRLTYWEDFLCYSNTTTGVVVLALGSAPDNSNILTPVDFYWGTTLTNGSVKIKADINGEVVLDTAHGAQNDCAALDWREANWGIGYAPSMEARVYVNSVTNCIYEVGWYVDGNDCCMFRFNPATSSSKWLTVYENNNGGEVSYTTTATCAYNTWYTLRVEMVGTTGKVRFWVNGVVVKEYTTAVLRNVAFKPHFYAKVTDAGHAAAKIMHVDYVKIQQNRL